MTTPFKPIIPKVAYPLEVKDKKTKQQLLTHFKNLANDPIHKSDGSVFR